QGANYPDALLLDAALRAYLDLARSHPEHLLALQGDDVLLGNRKRLRRRALRQALLLRRIYEGHAVPDAPTSPGENARVLPSPWQRVPEEQILSVTRRRKQLYEGMPSPSPSEELLQACLEDLAHPDELRELGTAVFLDRPLGILK